MIDDISPYPILVRAPELSACLPDLQQAISLLIHCFQQGNKLLVCGNGGSAADSEHIVGELMKGFLRKRPLPEVDQDLLLSAGAETGEVLRQGLQGALPAISLVGHPSFQSAFANDVSSVLAFAQGVWGYGQPGDVLLALSTSGRSRNILYALHAARARGLHTIGLTGEEGGEMPGLCHVLVRAPTSQAPAIQEYHVIIYHAICAAVEAAFFPV